MKQKYDWPDKIPDQAIREAFASANSVSFSARRFNHILYRSVAFGDLGWWLPLTRVLPLIGITPQMLRPVFNPHRRMVKCGLMEVELPEYVESYEKLGDFPLTYGSFQKLARVFGKSVEVLREDGGTGYHYPLFTAHPSGIIVKATTN